MAIRILLKKAGIIKEIVTKENLVLAEVIKNSGIVGAEFAQCGFNLDCGTCAVKITPEIEEAEIEEEMVLRAVGKDTKYRCSCQIKISSNLNNSSIEIS